MKLKSFLTLAASVLRRLDSILPPEPQKHQWKATAYRWQSYGNRGLLMPIERVHTFPVSRLAAVGSQTERLVRNTEQFIAGRPANNVLLTGPRGTGKSSLVKAMLHEYAAHGLRLIETDKNSLATLAQLMPILQQRQEKFIFCDDLSFEDGDDSYKALKSALDGSLEQRSPNILIYATSNRRHLMPEYMADNLPHTDEHGQIHPKETAEEKVSLSDRFGLWLGFYPFDQNDYLAAVEAWLQDFGLNMDTETRAAAPTLLGVWCVFVLRSVVLVGRFRQPENQYTVTSSCSCVPLNK